MSKKYQGQRYNHDLRFGKAVAVNTSLGGRASAFERKQTS